MDKFNTQVIMVIIAVVAVLAFGLLYYNNLETQKQINDLKRENANVACEQKCIIAFNNQYGSCKEKIEEDRAAGFIFGSEDFKINSAYAFSNGCSCDVTCGPFAHRYETYE